MENNSTIQKIEDLRVRSMSSPDPLDAAKAQRKLEILRKAARGEDTEYAVPDNIISAYMAWEGREQSKGVAAQEPRFAGPASREDLSKFEDELADQQDAETGMVLGALSRAKRKLEEHRERLDRERDKASRAIVPEDITYEGMSTKAFSEKMKAAADKAKREHGGTLPPNWQAPDEAQPFSVTNPTMDKMTLGIGGDIVDAIRTRREREILLKDAERLAPDQLEAYKDQVREKNRDAAREFEYQLLASGAAIPGSVVIGKGLRAGRNLVAPLAGRMASTATRGAIAPGGQSFASMVDRGIIPLASAYGGQAVGGATMGAVADRNGDMKAGALQGAKEALIGSDDLPLSLRVAQVAAPGLAGVAASGVSAATRARRDVGKRYMAPENTRGREQVALVRDNPDVVAEGTGKLPDEMARLEAEKTIDRYVGEMRPVAEREALAHQAIENAPPGSPVLEQYPYPNVARQEALAEAMRNQSTTTGRISPDVEDAFSDVVGAIDRRIGDATTSPRDVLMTKKELSAQQYRGKTGERIDRGHYPNKVYGAATTGLREDLSLIADRNPAVAAPIKELLQADEDYSKAITLLEDRTGLVLGNSNKAKEILAPLRARAFRELPTADKVDIVAALQAKLSGVGATTKPAMRYEPGLEELIKIDPMAADSTHRMRIFNADAATGGMSRASLTKSLGQLMAEENPDAFLNAARRLEVEGEGPLSQARAPRKRGPQSLESWAKENPLPEGMAESLVAPINLLDLADQQSKMKRKQGVK